MIKKANITWNCVAAFFVTMLVSSASSAQISLQMPFDEGQWWGPATYDGHYTGWGTGREKCIDWWLIVNQTNNQPAPNERPQWRQDGNNSRGKIVRAAHSGWVARKQDNPGGYGQYAVIRSEENGDYLTLYGHMDNYDACPAPGQHINAGQVIGVVGSTGNTGGAPHLHFELLAETISGARTNGQWVSKVLPGVYMDGQMVDFLSWTSTQNLGFIRYEARPMKSQNHSSTGGGGGGTADIIYVGPGGNESNDGKTWGSRVASIARAVALVNAGGTIRAGGGNYAKITITKKLTIVSHDGGVVRIGP